MTPAENKFLSDAIIDMLPDEPKHALAVLVLTFANVVVATGALDDEAHSALTIALRQMRNADRSRAPERGSA
ncbi:MAG: hypothetical protein J0H53_05400 [Rhizobiales bacterium]|nr:hypothetical protein [Hyphomicrobiales bacterium]OJU37158.1 MAG: hypothetical protein BGN94_08195 [Rhizobiales bacterium 68-8]